MNFPTLNIPLFLTNCCGDCPDTSKIPMLVYQGTHYGKSYSTEPTLPCASKSEIFYDCLSVESKRTLSRRRSVSSGHLSIDNCRNYLRAAASCASIESQKSLRRDSSELMLKQCKRLLESYNLNIPSCWTDGSALSQDDLELLRQIILANERYHYLSQEDVELLEDIAERADRLLHPEEMKMFGDVEPRVVIDEAWEVMEELFRKRSVARIESHDEAEREEPTFTLDEVDGTHVKSAESEMFDEYFNVDDDEQQTETLDFDIEDMIETSSLYSFEMPLEEDYSTIDYSQLIMADDLSDFEEIIQTVRKNDKNSRLEPNLKAAQNAKDCLRKTPRSITLHKLNHEWYAFCEGLKIVEQHVQFRLTLTGFCIEFEIKYMTFEELKRTGQFYKIKPRTSSLELMLMDVEEMKKKPVELLDILKPSDVSYLHRKVMADIEGRFDRLHEKLERIQNNGSTVKSKSNSTPKMMKKEPVSRIPISSKFKSKHVSRKATLQDTGYQKIKISESDEEFHEVHSSSSMESIASSYRTARDIDSNIKYKNFSRNNFLINNRFTKLLKS